MNTHCLIFCKARYRGHMTQTLSLQGGFEKIFCFSNIWGQTLLELILSFLSSCLYCDRMSGAVQPFSFHEVTWKKKSDILRIPEWKDRKKSDSLMTSIYAYTTSFTNSLYHSKKSLSGIMLFASNHGPN